MRPNFMLLVSSGVSCDFVITARNEEALEETKQLIIARAPGTSVKVVAGDLGDMDHLPSLCSQLFETIDQSRHKLGLLVNNAGTMNDFITPFLSKDMTQINSYMSVNLTSMMFLTTRFLTAFPQPGERCIVHMTSLLAQVFVPGFSLYSISRAARETFMKVLKVECPDVRLLGYSPGPCDTDMYNDIPDSMKTSPQKLSPKQSIEKLTSILRADQFENGSVIDYFDKELMGISQSS